MIHRFADRELDTDTFALRRGDDRNVLAPRVFRALQLLLENPHRVVGREELLRTVWDDAVVSDSSVSQCIYQLRKAVGKGPDGEPIIEGVYGRGYRLRAAVETFSGAEPDLAWQAALPGHAERTVEGFDGRPAVAVLPFVDLSEGSSAHFADGLSDDLTTRLASWRLFPVISRASAFCYRGSGLDLTRIGQELGVRYAIEGSVRRVGDRVRVNASAVDAARGCLICSERYEARLGDVLGAQEEIAQALSAAIEPELRRVESERAMRRDPADLDAWDCFMRGAWHYFRYTPEDNRRAREWFARAHRLDAFFATPLAAAALSHLHDANASWGPDPAASVRHAFLEAQRAVDIDPRESLAHGVLGGMLIVLGRREQATSELELSIHQNPSSAISYWGLGRGCSIWGEAERAVGLFQRALRLSPRDPVVPHFLEGLGFAHFALGDYARAAEAARRSVAARGDWARAYQLLAASQARLGHATAARDALGRARELSPRLTMKALRLSYEQANAEPRFFERYESALRDAGWADPA